MERVPSHQQPTKGSIASRFAPGTIGTRPVPSLPCTPPSAASSAAAAKATSPAPCTASKARHAEADVSAFVDSTKEVAGQLRATADGLATSHTEFQTLLERMTEIAGHLQAAADERAAVIAGERDEALRRVEELQAENAGLRGELEQLGATRQNIIDAADRAAETIRALQLEQAQLREELNLVSIAKAAEIESLTAVQEQQHVVIADLRETVAGLTSQTQELDVLLREAEASRGAAAEDRARRSAELRSTRESAAAASSALQERVRELEGDAVGLAEAMEEHACRFSGRAETSQPRQQRRRELQPLVRARTAADEVLLKLESLMHERDEARHELVECQAAWAKERAQLLASRSDALHAVEASAREIAGLKTAAVNTATEAAAATAAIAPPPAKPAVMSLRQARAQYKLGLSATSAMTAGDAENALRSASSPNASASCIGSLAELEDLSSALRQRGQQQGAKAAY